MKQTASDSNSKDPLYLYLQQLTLAKFIMTIGNKGWWWYWRIR